MTELLAHYKFIFIALFFQGITFSQVLPDPVLDSLFRTGINNVINNKYDEAEKTFSALKKLYPENPLGDTYLAATELTKNIDLAEPYNAGYITLHLEEAKFLVDELLSTDKNNIWNMYYKALVEGNYAMFRAQEESYLKAASAALSSINYFEDCLEQDDTFYDAYVAIGIYKYWKSKKMSWLPFVPNETEEGKELLKSCLQKNSYNSYIASYSLMWALIEEKNFNEAIKVGEEALQRYPNNRTVKWVLGRAYEDVDTLKSIEYYTNLLEDYKSIKISNRINEFKLKLKIAQQLQKTGNKAQAALFCNDALSIKNLSAYEQKVLSTKIDAAKKLKKELEG